MNKKTIVASLLKIADTLDEQDMAAEADVVTRVAQSVVDAPMSATDSFLQNLDEAQIRSAEEQERKNKVNAVISLLGDLEASWQGTDEQEAELEQLREELDSFTPSEVLNAPAFDDNMSLLRDEYAQWDAIEEMLYDERMEEQGGPPATTRDLVDMG